MQRTLKTLFACNGAWLTKSIGFSRYFSSVRTEKSAPPFGLLLFFFYLLFVFFSFFFITSLVTTFTLSPSLLYISFIHAIHSVYSLKTTLFFLIFKKKTRRHNTKNKCHGNERSRSIFVLLLRQTTIKSFHKQRQPK